MTTILTTPKATYSDTALKEPTNEMRTVIKIAHTPDGLVAISGMMLEAIRCIKGLSYAGDSSFSFSHSTDGGCRITHKPTEGSMFTEHYHGAVSHGSGRAELDMLLKMGLNVREAFESLTDDGSSKEFFTVPHPLPEDWKLENLAIVHTKGKLPTPHSPAVMPKVYLVDSNPRVDDEDVHYCSALYNSIDAVPGNHDDILYVETGGMEYAIQP